MEIKLFFQNSKGDNLCAILSNPTGNKNVPIIIMMHGFASTKNTAKNIELQNVWSKAGIATFRFDAYGHGESEGKFEDITATEGVDDVLQAISFLKQQGYIKIGLTGSSFGGLCSMIAASKTNDLFVLGLICPVSDIEEVELLRRSEEGLKEWKQKGFSYFDLHTGEELKLNYAYFEDIKHNIGYNVAKDITVPTIIVHGDADKNVPIKQSIKLSKLIPHSKFVVVNGADHRFTEEENFNEMIKEVSEFVIEQTKK